MYVCMSESWLSGPLVLKCFFFNHFPFLSFDIVDREIPGLIYPDLYPFPRISKDILYNIAIAPRSNKRVVKLTFSTLEIASTPIGA